MEDKPINIVYGFSTAVDEVANDISRMQLNQEQQENDISEDDLTTPLARLLARAFAKPLTLERVQENALAQTTLMNQLLTVAQAQVQVLAQAQASAQARVLAEALVQIQAHAQAVLMAQTEDLAFAALEREKMEAILATDNTFGQGLAELFNILDQNHTNQKNLLALQQKQEALKQEFEQSQLELQREISEQQEKTSQTIQQMQQYARQLSLQQTSSGVSLLAHSSTFQNVPYLMQLFQSISQANSL